ncbi:MAG: CRTAC1 family protein, partial [Planctomycetales bacterium]
GRFYTITEQAGPSTPAPPEAKPLFAQVDHFSTIPHEEKPFDDFQSQPLLPWKLSQLGPGIAVGDIDGDGDDDLVSSGAAGQETQIHVNDGAGRFSPNPSQAVSAHASGEDMAPLLFDADGDGDLDLYVASGGVEYVAGAEVLRDRLYLNNGQGVFEKAALDALPNVHDSSSVATAADFDGDGDLDLFVGGRVVPGQYPLPATSRLLRNQGGVFQDVTEELAPGLAQFGLVTGALWSDINNDARPDLLVTTEWGPIGIFINNDGRLVDETKRAGLANELGWWNGIASADFDHDGDMDYVVTNFGLNTKYHATPETPTLLYYGSFDASGSMQLVEAEREGDLLVPVRGRSCMSNAIPMLASKFPSYRSFGMASLDQICTKQSLQNAHQFKATRLDSVVLINEGDSNGPRFSVQPLPNLAQVAPGFGVLATDLNGDGHADIFMAQNFFGPQPETGRMDGGLSLLLEGDGKGTFQEVWPNRSGIVVPGDAKAAAICDLDGNNRPDLLVSRNDSEMIAFTNESTRDNRFLAVHLKAKKPNSDAIGARVTLVLSDETRQTAEVHSGSGYLSQSTPVLFFGLGANANVREIRVRWPSGKTTVHQVDPSATQADISQP